MNNEVIKEIQDYIQSHNLTAEEFLADLNKIQIEQEKAAAKKKREAQLREIQRRQQARQSTKERKKRNHLLFVVGGTVNKYLKGDFKSDNVELIANALENFLLEARSADGKNLSEYLADKKEKSSS